MLKFAMAGVMLIGLAGCQPAASPPGASSSQIASSSQAASSVSVPAARPSLSADEQGLGTPQAFLEAIYKHAAVNLSGGDFGTLGDNRSDYYDPDLTALIDTNERLYQGEVGAADAEPICQCQDWGPFKTVIQATQTGDATAKATVTLTFGDVPKPIRLSYDLVRIAGHWRIHDLGAPDYRSLRALYIKSNKDGAAEASGSAA